MLVNIKHDYTVLSDISEVFGQGHTQRIIYSSKLWNVWVVIHLSYTLSPNINYPTLSSLYGAYTHTHINTHVHRAYE